MWLRRLLLPFFVIQLLIVDSPTLAKLGLVVARSQKLLGVSLVLFLGVLLSFSISSKSPLHQLALLQAPVTQQVLGVQDPATAPDRTPDLAKWQKLYQLQPQHRDILVNLSYVYHQLGQESEAQKYWQAAQQLDPNNPLFQTKNVP